MTGRGAARSGSERAITIRNVMLAVLGAAVLVLRPTLDGPLREPVHAYAGNVAVSFAMYFATLNATSRYRRPRLVAAALTFLAVEVFEVTDGFGIMANTYDPIDLLANAAGVGLAVIVDLATTPIVRRRHERGPDGANASA